MNDDRNGQTAVIFVSRRTDADDEGYAAAAEAMDRLAAAQPGYRGIDSARGDDGVGVTVSYWADDAAAVAWRQHAEHTAIRERGRAFWYDRYSVSVATVTRVSLAGMMQSAAVLRPLRKNGGLTLLSPRVSGTRSRSAGSRSHPV